MQQFICACTYLLLFGNTNRQVNLYPTMRATSKHICTSTYARASMTVYKPTVYGDGRPLLYATVVPKESNRSRRRYFAFQRCS
ncbi:hypothetical protein EDC01DRAFT_660180 [Geopyxis carbonaria]|nr:hypothetical protein EDC01DRAFT_660180 [Geopyxis carbonaria]